jgi:pSer/pThr/pTyr-binding forkhead associated (FHA) protein
VITTTGVHISCEMVILAIGIDPLTDLPRSAGIACGRGVKVDDTLRTSAPDIYAAGDLVEITNPITGHGHVIGQWYPAIQQARAAAYTMLDLLDTKQPFRFGNFYNATFLYGLDFAAVGLTTIPRDGQGYQEVVADPQPRTYQKVILKEGVPVGMLALGDRRNVLTFKRAIDAQVNLSSVAGRLFAPGFKLNEWLDSQGIPPPILSITRVGTAAVRDRAHLVPTPLPSRLLLLNTDGSLTIPGTRNTLPASAVTLLKEGPALIAIEQGNSEIFPLKQGKRFLLGRGKGNDIVLSDLSISRTHAEVSPGPDGFYIRDLESSNGVLVNQSKIDNPHRLIHGDRITMGNTTMYFLELDERRSFMAHASLQNGAEPLAEATLTKSASTVGTQLKSCRRCGTASSNKARFCPHCGEPL